MFLNSLSMNVSSCLDQDTVSLVMDLKWPMETIKHGGMSCGPEKRPPAKAVNLSGLCFLKSLLRCEDCQTCLQFTNAYDTIQSGKEGKL